MPRLILQKMECGWRTGAEFMKCRVDMRKQRSGTLLSSLGVKGRISIQLMRDIPGNFAVQVFAW